MWDDPSDERLDFLIGNLTERAKSDQGFANYTMMIPELLSALKELKSARERPLHCPCCDGDHE